MFFDRGKEGTCRFEIAPGKFPEYFHIETYPVQFFIVFCSFIGSGTDKVTEIRQYKSRHRCVEVDHTKKTVILIEQHIVDFCIAMGNAFG